MRNGILMLLLALSCGSAMAEWVLVGKDNQIKHYADPDTIRRKGNIVKMWSLYDMLPGATPFGPNVRSVTLLREFDCKEERSRSLSFSSYGGQMAHGKVSLTSDDVGKWKPVAPRTANNVYLKFACSKKK